MERWWVKETEKGSVWGWGLQGVCPQEDTKPETQPWHSCEWLPIDLFTKTPSQRMHANILRPSYYTSLQQELKPVPIKAASPLTNRASLDQDTGTEAKANVDSHM